MIYSALMSHSSIVAERPRFNSTGTLRRPTARSKSKFCIFLAPIWIRSTFFSRKVPILSALINSVTTGSCTSLAASMSISSPFSRSPWKEYGDVLGLNAPPRRRDAPEFLTACATVWICSGVSMEHGPAITTSFFPPTLTPLTSIMEFCGWKERLARLYGSCTLITFSTHSLPRKSRSSSLNVSPISPSTTLLSPWLRDTLNPLLFNSVSRFSTAVSGAFCFITIIIKSSSAG